MNWLSGWLKGTIDNFWTAYEDELSKKHKETLEKLLQGEITPIDAVKSLLDVERELIELGRSVGIIFERVEYVNEHLRVILSAVDSQKSD